LPSFVGVISHRYCLCCLFLTRDGDDLSAITGAVGSCQCLLMICGVVAGTDTGGLSPPSGSGSTSFVTGAATGGATISLSALFKVPCSVPDPDVTGSASAVARTIVAVASSGDAVGHIFTATATRMTAKKPPASQTVRNIRRHPIRREESRRRMGPHDGGATAIQRKTNRVP